MNINNLKKKKIISHQQTKDMSVGQNPATKVENRASVFEIQY